MKGMLHRLFKEQSIPLENVNKLRKLGNVVSGNGTVDYVIELSGNDGDMEYYNYSLVGTDVEEVGEGYFVLNDVEVRDSDSAKKNYYKGKSFDYSMEYEKPLNSLEFFYEMVYGRAGDMFLKPPYSKYLGAEGGEQYDYYTIERDYDEGYMNARVPTLKTNRLFDPLYYTQYMMMNDMSDRISTAFHPNAEVREQSGYGTREKQRDAIFNGLKSWNEQMIEDLNGVKRSIDMELGDRKFEAEGDYTQPRSRAINNILWELRDLDAEQMFYTILTYIPTKQANQLLNQLAKGLEEGEIPNRNLRLGAEELGAEESINPKDYIAISFLDQQGNGHPTTLLNTYDLRFGERGSTYFKALREALDEGVKRGDYEGYKIKKTTSKPLQDEDYVYERRYNDEYDYEVWLMGDKFFYGDSGIPVVKNKYTINEGEPKFADMVFLITTPKKKRTEPMNDLGSLFGAEAHYMKQGFDIQREGRSHYALYYIIKGDNHIVLDYDRRTDYGNKPDAKDYPYAYGEEDFSTLQEALNWFDKQIDGGRVFTDFGTNPNWNAENFEAKGIDTFTEPFAELKSGSILNKAILLGSLSAGAMIGLKLRK